jgi:hypothetical protein
MRRSERQRMAARRQRVTDLILAIYERVGRDTTDRTAQAAIRGLIQMVRHATDIIAEYDLAAPVPDDGAEATLQAIIDNWDDEEIRSRLIKEVGLQ